MKRPVPSIYYIGPPNDGSVFRNGHQIDLVDFAIDHEHLAHTRMHRSSAKLSGISRPKPLLGQQSPGFIQPKPSNTKTMAALSYDFTLLAGWKWLGFFISGDAVEGLAPQKLRDITAGYRPSEFEAVPSIYSIVPPNDGSALRHGHHFEPVDFVIDHGRGHHDAYSAGSCQRTYARACGCRQRPRRHREELIEPERGWSGREAFVTMMQTADLGQGNDRSGPGQLNGSSIRCVLAERQVGP